MKYSSDSSALCVVTLLIALLFPPSLSASTAAGELIVTGKDGNHYTALLGFNEYFSGPREFMPGQSYHSSRADHPGPFKKNHTVTYIDGRMVTHDVMFKAMLPGRRAYLYESRGQIEFVHLHTHPLPIQGHLMKTGDNRVELKRFMTRRYESGTPVFQWFEAEIASDAHFYLDGKPATKKNVLLKDPPANYLLRVFPAQQQTISAFRPESEAPLSAFGPDHAGAKTGYMLRTGKVEFTKSNGKTSTLEGATLQVLHNGNWKEEEMPIDRKGYMILDGRHIPWRSQALRQGAYGVGATYRGWKKAKYFLVRSELQAAWNGKIMALSSKGLKVKQDLSGETVSVPFSDSGRVLLDGIPANAGALQIGMQVTIFDQRPQAVEGMTQCYPPSRLAKRGREGKLLMIIEYGIDGNRRVTREGAGPYWEEERSSFFSDFKGSAGKRYPPALAAFPKDDAKEKAMKLTPETGPFYWTIPEYPPVPWK